MGQLTCTPEKNGTLMSDKVMIVDDDPGIRETLSALIEDLGYATITAEDGLQACDVFEQGPFLCVFTDIMMPNMTGIELIKKIKSRDISTPVIVITGHASIEVAIDAMRHGASDFISKPFKTKQIEFIINKVKREKSILEENKRFSDELHLHRMIDNLAGQLEDKSQEITSLQTISDRITSLKGIRDIVNAIVEVSKELFDESRVTFCPVNRQNLQLITPEGEEMDLDQRLIRGNIVQEVLCIHGINENKTTFPLLIEGQIFGTLCLITRRFLSRDEQSKILYLLQRTGERMENVALYEGLYESVLATLYSMAKVLDARDPYTSQHSTRVTALSIDLAKAMQLPDEDRDVLYIASSLHDIGKVGVPDSILRKPDKLSVEEFDIIKRHPDIGADILKAIAVMYRETEVIRHHHERFDGAGYPSGMVGVEIPLLSRVIALADTFDAMTTDRPYRKGLSADQAIQEIIRCKGTQFDPDIAEIFIGIAKEF
ncbi:MAG: HD domain-containing phosphohydrolase [Syntrophaceae bacterium]